MKFNLQLIPEVEFILKTLEENGFEGYLVGGAVRDILLAKKQDLDVNQILKDYDFTTNAPPEKIQHLFPESFYENEFGTVAITHQELLTQMGLTPEEIQEQQQNHPLVKKNSDNNSVANAQQKLIDLEQAEKIHDSLLDEKNENQVQSQTLAKEEKPHFLPNFEITTYRSGEVYADFRRPDPSQLTWGKSIQEDLTRRDFTLNAMALKRLKKNTFELIDPFSGLEDLNHYLIKTVNQPQERFGEDALRMLRAIRFAVQLNMQIEEETFAAILKQAKLITKISWERIRDEFLKIIKSQFPAEGIGLLDEAGLLRHILPELISTKGVEQGGHHTTDVWTHSLDALKECPSSDPIVRLATLLHDIAKPATFEVRNEKITFYNHEIVGSRIADKIGKRLRLSKDQRRRLFTLVRHHMFYYQPHHTDAAIRRFMRKVGLENIDDILAVREGDRLGSGARKTSWRLEEMKERMIEQLNQPLSVKDLAIDGHDLMQKFKLKPGPWLGKMMQQLLEKVMDEPELNTKEKLLELSQNLVEKTKKI